MKKVFLLLFLTIFIITLPIDANAKSGSSGSSSRSSGSSMSSFRSTSNNKSSTSKSSIEKKTYSWNANTKQQEVKKTITKQDIQKHPVLKKTVVHQKPITKRIVIVNKPTEKVIERVYVKNSSSSNSYTAPVLATGATAIIISDQVSASETKVQSQPIATVYQKQYVFKYIPECADKWICD